MRQIDWNYFTPECYSIGAQEDVDVGVAADMLFHNIREGRAVHSGAAGLAPLLTPDYPALKALWDGCGAEERRELTAGFNAWLGRMRAAFSGLAGLWRQKRYFGMIDLVEQERE